MKTASPKIPLLWRGGRRKADGVVHFTPTPTNIKEHTIMQRDPWDYPNMPPAEHLRLSDPTHSPGTFEPREPPPPVDPKAYRFVGPTTGEIVAGVVYLVLHMFIVAEILFFLFDMAGVMPSLMVLNVLYFAIGTVVLLICMRRYLKVSFVRFRQFGASKNALTILIGYGVTFGLAMAVGIVVSILAPDVTNYNQEAVEALMGQNIFISLFIAVILAPFLEELLFRGAIFAPLRRKNRILAYAVSTLAFAFLHIASALFFAPFFDLFFVMLVYIPSGLVLAWVYERSGNIWTAISLHAVWNLIAVLLGLLYENLDLEVYSAILYRIL